MSNSKRFIIITIGSDDKDEAFEHEMAEMMKQKRFTFKDRHYQYTSPTMKGVLTKIAFEEEKEEVKKVVYRDLERNPRKKGGETSEQEETAERTAKEERGTDHHQAVP